MLSHITERRCTLVVLFVAFSENESGEISAELDQYLQSISATGQTLYVYITILSDIGIHLLTYILFIS